ncbi:L,D-transpeptidase family protein [Arcobacter aquimarinus]|uniref:L,D-transpeptidase family protein n=1 Tax=Arcobacter aquimarinus TaxID=1315211 RepID=UPI003BB1440F
MNRLKFIVVSIFFINSYLIANLLESKNSNINDYLLQKYKPTFTNKKNLTEYYKQNNYQTFWTQNNEIKNISIQLLEKIKNDPVLKSNDLDKLKITQIENKLESLNNLDENFEEKLLEIDFLLTELYDKYSSYLLEGSINWKAFQNKLKDLEKQSEIKAQWDRYKIEKDKKRLLIEASKNNDLSISFNQLDYNFPNANKLLDSIKQLEQIAQNGDYIKLPPFKTLRIGDKSPIVKTLRERLAQSENISINCENIIDAQNLTTNVTSLDANIQNQEIQTEENISCEEIFDEDLKNAVISFQQSHGLYADGIVGLQTQNFLNMSAKEKINKIKLNLERMRWLPRDFGEKYLLVNIPEYKLRVIENNNIKLNMAVIVGDKKYPTPIFSDKMSYIVLNPNWNIPESITKKEILPKLLKDPNYLDTKGIEIYQGWDRDASKIETKEVIETLILQDIESVPNFRFTQGPSNENPLGKVKFMFPNKHAVYLHDTPAKSLFANARRAYSHGCIRLSKPQELLNLIATDDKNMTLQKADEFFKEANEKSVGLNNKIPIHIIYLTAWVDENGKLQFREDIYNFDKMQKELLF